MSQAKSSKKPFSDEEAEYLERLIEADTGHKARENYYTRTEWDWRRKLITKVRELNNDRN